MNSEEEFYDAETGETGLSYLTSDPVHWFLQYIPICVVIDKYESFSREYKTIC